VAPKKKGNDAQRTVRYPSRLRDDLRLLAEANHRSDNDEIVVSIEQHIERNRAVINTMKKRRQRE
jgi:Arc-like DNA binding domain